MRMSSFSGGLSRRRFLQVSAAGVVTVGALGTGRALAEPYSKFTWISPPAGWISSARLPHTKNAPVETRARCVYGDGRI